MEGRMRAKAPSPPSPPAVRQVLGLLQRGQIDEAAAVCKRFPAICTALRSELQLAEEEAAAAPQDWTLPPLLGQRLAGWGAQGKAAQFRGFMLRAVDDPGDACQTQLTVQCSKKDRDLVLGQLQQLEGAGPSLKPFFCFTPYERQSGKKRAFGLTCCKLPHTDTAAVAAAQAKASDLRAVLQAAAVVPAVDAAVAAPPPAVGAAAQPAADTVKVHDTAAAPAHRPLTDAAEPARLAAAVVGSRHKQQTAAAETAAKLAAAAQAAEAAQTTAPPGAARTTAVAEATTADAEAGLPAAVAQAAALRRPLAMHNRDQGHLSAASGKHVAATGKRLLRGSHSASAALGAAAGAENGEVAGTSQPAKQRRGERRVQSAAAGLQAARTAAGPLRPMPR